MKLILLFLITIPQVHGQDFDVKHYKVVKDIIWSADKVGIPRELLLSICWGESSFRLNQTHLDGASLSYGICQVKLSTAQYMDKVYKHKHLITSARLENTKINAFYAAKYIHYQLKRYKGDWKLSVDAYNKHNAVSKHTAYVRKFNKNNQFIRSKLDKYIMSKMTQL
jgi:hypothetical protein